MVKRTKKLTVELYGDATLKARADEKTVRAWVATLSPNDLEQLISLVDRKKGAPQAVQGDWVEEHGGLRDWLGRYNRLVVCADPCCAEATLEALSRVNLGAVPVFPHVPRGWPRKELAVLVRRLFKSFGVPNVSVVVPTHSMASTVDITIPGRRDYSVFDSDGFICRNADPAMLANRAGGQKVEAILERAFPNHRDRSDSMTDYFNFCWSVTVTD